MKATKRLFKAIAALVASLILCIGVCLAWFAVNRKVEANDSNSRIGDINIKDFEVKAYRLTFTGNTNGLPNYTVGDEALSESVKMHDYGGLVNDDTTALLLEFSYTFYEDLGKTYAIFADCDSTRGEITGGTVDGEMRLNCALSSVISFYDIYGTQTGAKPAAVRQSTAKSAEAVEDTDGSVVTILDGITDTGADGTETLKFYCIIDYVENRIYAQYYRALTIPGTTFSTPMDFENDIYFYIVAV